MIYHNRISDLTKDNQNVILPISEITKWLDDNFDLFTKDNRTLKCKNRDLPCLCSIRRIECMFIEMYETLKDNVEIQRLNSYLENELHQYENIKNVDSKVKSWLNKNIHIGLNQVWFFMNKNYPNKKLSFVNGREDDELKYLNMEINSNDYKYIYDFANLFSRLFFEEKLLVPEYEKWKLKVGLID